MLFIVCVRVETRTGSPSGETMHLPPQDVPQSSFSCPAGSTHLSGNFDLTNKTIITQRKSSKKKTAGNQQDKKHAKKKEGEKLKRL